MPGKIDASLNEKLSRVKWGEYKLGDLFYVKTTKSIDKNKITFSRDGDYDFIGRSNIDNGVQGKVNYLGYAPNAKDTFSLVQVGETICLFRNNEWYASQNIFILSPKITYLSRQFLFTTATINKALYEYRSAYVYPTLEEVKRIKVEFPQTGNGEIDFDFMENFVAELESHRVAELESYLLATGLKDYTLTEEERNALENYNTMSFGKFAVIDVFDIKNTSNILSCDITENSGETPYLCASAENNSVSSYISYNRRYIEEGNCIFIGGKTFVVSWQKEDFFSNDSHNLALYYKGEQKDRLTQLFLATCIKKSLCHKYSWGNSISKSKIKEDYVDLPVKDCELDLQNVKTLISAIQKLVIKDVVLYADSKIAETKAIITK